MRKGPLQPSGFVPTKFSTHVDKAAFGNELLYFLVADCRRELFTKSLYNRLSMCFGHIAHCDRAGFYERWFSSAESQLEFLRHALQAPCWGQPEFTFSDVERAIQREIGRLGLLPRFELRAAQSARSADMKTLSLLEAKYRRESRVHPLQPSGEPVDATAGSSPTEPMPVQASLF